jgi:hypothetical protein
MPVKHPVRWTRMDGTIVPIELLDLHELVAAHQHILTGSWSAEDTPLMLAAIESELDRRWRRKVEDAPDSGSLPGDETPRAA